MNLKLIGWPLNICAFELGFGFGVGKALLLWFEPSRPPLWAKGGAVFFVVFLSAFLVCRYFPSDVTVEKNGSTLAVIGWINLSLLLAVIVPVISVFSFNSFSFWLLSVVVVAAKAVHSLEEKHRGRGDLHAIHSSNVPRVGVKLSFLARYIFSPNPDAYALRPFPTAFLFSIGAIGVTITWQGGKEYAVWGASLYTAACCAYNILSGWSRGVSGDIG